jgi:hypothetical protein
MDDAGMAFDFQSFPDPKSRLQSLENNTIIF